MSVMPLTDAVFLIAEARERPMHVAGLHLFRPPEDAAPNHVASLHRDTLQQSQVIGRLRRRAVRPPGGVGLWRWADDDDLDLEYHIRHSALPYPGRVRELLELVSRLHGTLLDRSRPLWEATFIEGLADGRFATYTKIHHAMMDGVSAMRLLERSLSPDPNERDMLPPLAERPPPTSRTQKPDVRTPLERAEALLSQTVDAVRGALGAGEEAARALARSFSEEAATFPFRAPPSMLNVPISGARRFAAESWPLERLRQVGKGLGGTLNDVVLAMSAGALRRYLLDLASLPEEPLIAMVPVSLRARGDTDDRGNAVGLLLCNLGTHLADPLARFGLVHESARQGKLQLQSLNPAGILVLSAMSFLPLGFGPLYRFQPLPRPPFNIVISNVPGPRRPLYWNGAELDGAYPASIPIDGQALNITCTSWGDRIGFGLTGCRRSVPSLQRLLEHLETSLTELEEVA